jgi:single-stranded DNA-binding protein
MNNVSLVGHLTRDPELKEIGGRSVNGRLVLREWTGRDRSKRSAHSVRGSVEFLGSRGTGGSPVGREPAEDLVPAF